MTSLITFAVTFVIKGACTQSNQKVIRVLPVTEFISFENHPYCASVKYLTSEGNLTEFIRSENHLYCTSVVQSN